MQPPPKNIPASYPCIVCNADWGKGGGALINVGCSCTQNCGGCMTKALIDTTERRMAHWVTNCRLQRPYTATQELWAALDSEDIGRLAKADASFLDERDQKWGETPLHHVCYFNKNLSVAFLLGRAQANIHAQGYRSGSTPLHSAAAGGNVAATRFLLSMGASPNARNFAGMTPLHSAVLYDHVPIIELLLKAGARCDILASQTTPRWLCKSRDSWLQFAASTATLRLQLASDLHVEFFDSLSQFGSLPVSAPVLVLAGDIGNPQNPTYEQFLLSVAASYERVFIVCGNHEFYGNPINTTRAAMRKFCEANPKLVFLDRTSYEYRGVRFMGCTLWAHVPAPEMASVSEMMNDYRQIRWDGDGAPRLLTVEDTNRIHREDVAWLTAELQKAKAERKKVVVVTHHMPVTSAEKAEPAFSTFMPSLYGEPVVAWLYGHTHHSLDWVHRGTRIASNQLGYVRMHRKDPRFIPGFVMEV